MRRHYRTKAFVHSKGVVEQLFWHSSPGGDTVHIGKRTHETISLKGKLHHQNKSSLHLCFLQAIIAAGVSLGFSHSDLHNYSGRTSSSLTRKTRCTRGNKQTEVEKRKACFVFLKCGRCFLNSFFFCTY